MDCDNNCCNLFLNDMSRKIEFQNDLTTCDVSNRSCVLDMMLPVDHMDPLWTEHVRIGGGGVKKKKCELMNDLWPWSWSFFTFLIQALRSPASPRLIFPWNRLLTLTRSVGLQYNKIRINHSGYTRCRRPKYLFLLMKLFAHVETLFSSVLLCYTPPLTTLWFCFSGQFYPYVLLVLAILVYSPVLFWRFTAAPQLSSDLKFIMVELDRFYNRAIELAKKRVSSKDTPGSTKRWPWYCLVLLFQ